MDTSGIRTCSCAFLYIMMPFYIKGHVRSCLHYILVNLGEKPVRSVTVTKTVNHYTKKTSNKLAQVISLKTSLYILFFINDALTLQVQKVEPETQAKRVLRGCPVEVFHVTLTVS